MWYTLGVRAGLPLVSCRSQIFGGAIDGVLQNVTLFPSVVLDDTEENKLARVLLCIEDD